MVLGPWGLARGMTWWWSWRVCCVVVGVLAGVEFDGMVAIVAVVGMLKGCGMVLTSECRLVMLGYPIRCCEEAGGSLHSL